MKIGVLTYDFFPFEGGLGRHIYEIYYKGLQKKFGVEIVYITPCLNQIENNRTYFHFTKKFGKNISFSICVNSVLDKIIWREKIDILNIHCGPGGVFLMKRPKCKGIVATVHHTYYQQYKFVKSQFYKKMLYYWEYLTYKFVDYFITVSEDTKKRLIDYYKIENNRICSIPNPVDLTLFRQIHSIKKERGSMLFVGRLDERKGVRFLLQFVPLIIKNIPDVRLYIIGEGRMTKDIESWIQKEGYTENVKLVGQVADEDLNEWYNKVTLTVIPSVFEGFGLVAIESMAAGTFVVASDTDGLRDVIQKVGGGVLIKYGDLEKWVSVIVKILKGEVRINIDRDKLNVYALDRVVRAYKDIFYKFWMISRQK